MIKLKERVFHAVKNHKRIEVNGIYSLMPGQPKQAVNDALEDLRRANILQLKESIIIKGQKIPGTFYVMSNINKTSKNTLF